MQWLHCKCELGITPYLCIVQLACLCKDCSSVLNMWPGIAMQAVHLCTALSLASWYKLSFQKQSWVTAFLWDIARGLLCHARAGGCLSKFRITFDRSTSGNDGASIVFLHF